MANLDRYQVMQLRRTLEKLFYLTDPNQADAEANFNVLAVSIFKIALQVGNVCQKCLAIHEDSETDHSKVCSVEIKGKYNAAALQPDHYGFRRVKDRLICKVCKHTSRGRLEDTVHHFRSYHNAQTAVYIGCLDTVYPFTRGMSVLNPIQEPCVNLKAIISGRLQKTWDGNFLLKNLNPFQQMDYLGKLNMIIFTHYKKMWDPSDQRRIELS